MKKACKNRIRKVVIALWHFLIFFMLISFVITCCMILFLGTMQNVMGIELRQEEIQRAAKLTFANVILISLLCSVIDALRRRIMVGRPVRKIIGAAHEVMKGNLSVRIERMNSIDPDDGFNIIIDYFNRMIEELSGMETLRTDFIANVSHELKTPLAIIQNYGEMLNVEELSEEKRHEYAGAVKNAAGKLADMVTNILRLNKLENQTIYPAAGVYDIGEQLCECLLGFERGLEDKRLKVDTSIAENIKVEADPELLSLVWNNLFSNAIKFTEPGGRISVAMEADKELAVVKVSDTGCGISKETGAHIFEKFYQGDTSHGAKGNGLGLALVKRVMDIIGGDIEVSSEVGRGSTFTVRLRRVTDGTV